MGSLVSLPALCVAAGLLVGLIDSTVVAQNVDTENRFDFSIAERIKIFRPDVAKLIESNDLNLNFFNSPLTTIITSYQSQGYEYFKDSVAILLYRGICLDNFEEYNPRYNNSHFGTARNDTIFLSTSENMAKNYLNNHCDKPTGVLLKFQLPRFLFFGQKPDPGSVEPWGIQVIALRTYLPDDRPFLLEISLYKNPSAEARRLARKKHQKISSAFVKVLKWGALSTDSKFSLIPTEAPLSPFIQ